MYLLISFFIYSFIHLVICHLLIIRVCGPVLTHQNWAHFALRWGRWGREVLAFAKEESSSDWRSTNLMIVHVTEPFLVLPLFLNWHNGLRRFVCNQYACSHFILKMPVLCKCPLINSLNNFLSALAGAEEARNRSKKIHTCFEIKTVWFPRHYLSFWSHLTDKGGEGGDKIFETQLAASTENWLVK